ncbi:hypothetical protein Rhopal_006633-T1 [Rhodotorula paludigena]|uniref:Rrp15p-domain-containing protein n=1 Tax=Rhodotorula paludigena TaxID=86838 RepID=A0AAV5GMQ5_9BASI|nr:hypothetical protein Rhopal_006633-T1 [Rhodotorula paludigena]
MSSAQPKSILKKRPRAAVEPAVEEEPVAKGQQPSDAPLKVPAEELEGEDEDDEDEELDEASEQDFSAGSDEDEADGESDDDDDAIRELVGEGQERPAKKLKHTTLRPTTTTSFSSSLQHLLSLPSTSSNPVPKHAPPSAATLRLERRARSVLRETKAQHLARGHVRDVIGGWGSRPPLPFSQWESESARAFERARRGGNLEDDETGAEREKRLRKLAQRGVVRLFNAIGAAQGVTGKDKDIEEQEKRKKLALKAGVKEGANGPATNPGGTLSRRPNVLVTSLSKASFLDLIRAGTGA